MVISLYGHTCYTMLYVSSESCTISRRKIFIAKRKFFRPGETGEVMIHQVSPFLYESSDSRVHQGFNTTKARRVITNDSAIPIANVNCGVIQGLAKACANGPSNVPREMAVPRIPIT